MKEEIENIITELTEACDICDIMPDANTFLEQAVKIFLTKQIQSNKQDNIKQINSISPNSKSSPVFTRKEEPATEKQINYLKQLNVTIPAGLSKKEAYSLIQAKKK